MDENELVMIADNESTNGHPKVPTDNNVYPMYEEKGGGGDARHAVICFDLDSDEKTLFDAIMKSIDDRGVPHLSKSCVLKVLSAVRQRVVQQ